MACRFCLFDCLPKARKYWSIHLLCTLRPSPNAL